MMKSLNEYDVVTDKFGAEWTVFVTRDGNEFYVMLDAEIARYLGGPFASEDEVNRAIYDFNDV